MVTFLARRLASILAVVVLVTFCGISCGQIFCQQPETLLLATTAAPGSIYEEDLRFALEELENNCGRFFELKKIDWKKISKEFLGESSRVTNDQEHLVLLVRLLARLKDGHASVRRLEKGEGVQWPGEGKGKPTGPGMFFCRIGKKIYVKTSWATAEKAGFKPGMEVVKVNRIAVEKWLNEKMEEHADRIGFSTEQQKLFYTFHWGLSAPAGTRLELQMKDLRGRSGRGHLVYQSGVHAVTEGPAFFPPGIEKAGDLNHVRLKSGFGYIHVRRCPGDLPEQMDRVLSALGNVPGIILDFRGNSGGGFDHDAFLGRFIPREKRIQFRKNYKSSGPDPYGGPVVVIVNATVRSAGETASGIFKEDGRAYMIGESPTAGMSSGKTTIELPSRLFSLYVSTSSNMGRFNDGRGIEGIGVIPHEIVDFQPRELADGVDSLIRRAEEILKDFPKGKVPYDPDKFGWKK